MLSQNIYYFFSSIKRFFSVSKTRVPRSWGSEESSINNFPYLVNLNKYASQTCGGSILSPYFVITAAHCVYNKKDPDAYRIRAGSSFKNRGGSVHYVFNITVHPNCTKSDNSPTNDLALLRLGNPIDIDNIIRRSIPMFGIGENIEAGTEASVAGWGCTDENEYIRPEKLRSLKMNITDKNKCLEVYKNKDPIQQDEICASAASDDSVVRGVCTGDSGGPLVVKGKLAGVIKSIGFTQDSKVWPNKFTEISRHRNWIDGIVDYGLKVSLYCSLIKWTVFIQFNFAQKIPDSEKKQIFILEKPEQYLFLLIFNFS